MKCQEKASFLGSREAFIFACTTLVGGKSLQEKMQRSLHDHRHPSTLQRCWLHPHPLVNSAKDNAPGDKHGHKKVNTGVRLEVGNCIDISAQTDKEGLKVS